MSNKNDYIQWHDFSEQTLKIANETNKAIFLFVSYNSCKICKDMENEITTNKDCCRFLNENFISIKIDRFKRADIDRYLQKAHNLINKSQGGWPLCVFATPENKPFFASTYMNIESTGETLADMGFIDTIKLIHKRVSSKDKATLKNSDEIYQFLQKQNHPKEATKLSDDFVKNYMHQLKQVYQTRYGGFSKPPKFAQPNTLQTLMMIDMLYGDKAAKEMVQTTLDNLAKTFDNGFSRYFLNEDWSGGSEEKTLYDNALLCKTYTLAYINYKNKEYLEIAKKCANLKFDDDVTLHKLIEIDSVLSLASIEKSYEDSTIIKLERLLRDAKIEFLDEFAFLASSLLKAYHLTKQEDYLIKALQFTNKALERFYNHGGWLFCDNEFKTKADISDHIYTSCVSMIVEVLLDLSKTLEDESYLHYAYKTLEYNSYTLARDTIYYPSLLRAILNYLKER